MSKIKTLEQEIGYDTSKIARKSFLEKKIKYWNNQLKKYKKENNGFWITKCNYTIIDLEEQLKDLDNE